MYRYIFYTNLYTFAALVLIILQGNKKAFSRKKKCGRGQERNMLLGF